MQPIYKTEYCYTYYKKKTFAEKVKSFVGNPNNQQNLLGAALVILSIASFLLLVNEDATGALVLLLKGIAVVAY